MPVPEFSILLDSKTLSFTARHFITYRIGDKDSAPITEPIHAHKFRVTLLITGPLNADGLLIDFHYAQRILAEILSAADGKLIIALRQRGIEIHKTETGIELSYESESPETGTKKSERHRFHSSELFELDAVNGSAEQIAFHILSRFKTRFETETAVPESDAGCRYQLTLEESPGMKAVVKL